MLNVLRPFVRVKWLLKTHAHNPGTRKTPLNAVSLHELREVLLIEATSNGASNMEWFAVPKKGAF